LEVLRRLSTAARVAGLGPAAVRRVIAVTTAAKRDSDEKHPESFSLRSPQRSRAARGLWTEGLQYN
jgi:hypothetical protein